MEMVLTTLLMAGDETQITHPEGHVLLTCWAHTQGLKDREKQDGKTVSRSGPVIDEIPEGMAEKSTRATMGDHHP
jgi:hypothetical protein